MEKIKLFVNNKEYELTLEPSTRLLDVLRNHLGFKGVKEGCGEGACGACSVLVDGVPYNSCLTPVANVIGKHIITIDEFNKTPQYRIIADAFADLGGSQCGFCTPGMIINTYALFLKNPHPSEEEIKIALSGNICRCTGYNAIIRAVLEAAEKGSDIKW